MQIGYSIVQSDQRLYYFVRLLDRIILVLYMNGMLASVTEHVGLCLTWSETLKTCFLVTRLNGQIYRGYSNFLLNMAFISPSGVENIYIS